MNFSSMKREDSKRYKLSSGDPDYHCECNGNNLGVEPFPCGACGLTLVNITYRAFRCTENEIEEIKTVLSSEKGK